MNIIKYINFLPHGLYFFPVLHTKSIYNPRTQDFILLCDFFMSRLGHHITWSLPLSAVRGEALVIFSSQFSQ